MTSADSDRNKRAARPIHRLLRWLGTSISRRITAAVLVLTLAVSAVLAGGSYLLSRRLVEARIAGDLSNEATLAARQMESTLNILYADLSRLATNGILVQAMADPSVRDAYLETFFKGYSGPGRLPATLSLHDVLGRPVTGTAPDAPLPSYEGVPWLRRVIQLGLTYTEIVGEGAARDLIIARPVPAPAGGASAGFLVVRTPIDDIFRRAMSSFASEFTRRLKTDRGEILVQTDSRKLIEPVAAAQPVEPEVASFPGVLKLEVVGERAEVLEPLKLLAAGHAVIAGVILLILLRASRMLGRRLTSGLARLSEAASARAGASAAPLPVKGQDEVARLTAAFNAMIANTDDLHRQLENRVVERTVTLQDMNSALVKEILNHKKTGEQLNVAAKAIEDAAEGVMICDAEQRIVSVNKAFSRITGYGAEEALGKHCGFLASADQRSLPPVDAFGIAREQGHWKGELWSCRKDGESYVEERSVSAVRDDDGQIGNFIILFSDVTRQKEDEERIQFLAHHDSLTGLPNRILFQRRCEEALLRASRRTAKAAVMFIDLDHFKTINDSLGYAFGDELLKAVAGRLQECIRKTDTVARLGGDEFTVLLSEVSDLGDIAFIAKKILDRLGVSFTVAGHEIYGTASIGISCYPDDGDSAAALIKNADAAMYAAKEQGRNSYQFFSSEMNAQALEALMMASSLRVAIDREELTLEYQPRIDFSTGAVKGVEALVRWNHPNLGRIMPGQFIGLAEKTGLIDPIGEWVLKKACGQMVDWRGSGAAPQRMAVNMSARQFRQPDFVDRVAAILQETGLEARALELEVTESMVMHDPQRAAVILERLKERGIAVAIDDFGTGHSSLSYLKRFPIDYIKIDQSFVRGIPTDAEDVGITRAIIALGRTLNLKLIAEGVDNYEQLAFLRKEGCNEGQGYLISSSLSADALRRFLDNLANPALALARLESRPAQPVRA